MSNETKLKEVKNKGSGNTVKAVNPIDVKAEKDQARKGVNSKENKEKINLVKAAAETASKEAAKEAARKVALEVSREVVNATIKNAVKKAEIIRKFPPPPDNIQRLSEPRKATYIDLYKKHRDALPPNTVNNVKGKIADYLKAIEERTHKNKLSKEKQINKRNKRKEKAIKEYSSNEYTKYCFAQSDEIFNKILEKFTHTDHSQEETKRLNIMGASSKKLSEHIQSQITNLIEPTTANDAIEIVEKLSYIIMEFVKNSSVEALEISP